MAGVLYLLLIMEAVQGLTITSDVAVCEGRPVVLRCQPTGAITDDEKQLTSSIEFSKANPGETFQTIATWRKVSGVQVEPSFTNRWTASKVFSHALQLTVFPDITDLGNYSCLVRTDSRKNFDSWITMTEDENCKTMKNNGRILEEQADTIWNLKEQMRNLSDINKKHMVEIKFLREQISNLTDDDRIDGSNDRDDSSDTKARLFRGYSIRDKALQRWRKGRIGDMEWNKKTEEKLRHKCDSWDDRPQWGPFRQSKVRILCIGPFGHGKSSLINSFVHALENDIGPKICPPPAFHEPDNKIQEPTFTVTGQSSYFSFMDMPGFRSSDTATGGKKGFQFSNSLMEKVILGHFPPGVEFPDNITDDTLKNTAGYVVQPDAAQKVCCVVVVLKVCQTVDSYLKEKIAIIRDLAMRNKVSMMIILTHVGTEDNSLCGNNARRMYETQRIKEAIENMEKELSIHQSSIFPVSSYTNETEVNSNMNILLLYTLNKILDMAKHCASRRG